MSAFAKIAYPTILTNDDWQAKKGVIAKMHGKTGIGDQMDKCQKAYDDIDWNTLAMDSGRGAWISWAKFKGSDWTKAKNSADAQVTGNVKKLRKALEDLQALALGKAKEFSDSRTYPAKIAQHAGNIAAAAGDFAGKFDENTVKAAIAKYYQDKIDFLQTTFVDGYVDLVKSAMSRFPAAIKKMRENPKGFTVDIVTPARDITQNVSNIIDAIKVKGFPHVPGFDAGKVNDLDKHNKVLVAYQTGKKKPPEKAPPLMIMKDINAAEKAYFGIKSLIR